MDLPKRNHEEDHCWKNRGYALKPGIRAQEIPESLLRFACCAAVGSQIGKR